jgi:adenosine deaminase
MDRAFGPVAGHELVDALVELRRTNAAGTDRLVGVGMDSTEFGVDPVSYLPAYTAARRAGLRLTAHQGENSPASAAAAAIEVLGVDRLDHGYSILSDPELVRRVAGERIPLTVCPNSNVRIANTFGRLEEHVYPQLRAADVLATLNTDDPALSDLDLGYEYRSVAAAFAWGWDEMVAIALDGVEACWLDDSHKHRLRQQIDATAVAARPDERSSSVQP